MIGKVWGQVRDDREKKEDIWSSSAAFLPVINNQFPRIRVYGRHNAPSQQQQGNRNKSSLGGFKYKTIEILESKL